MDRTDSIKDLAVIIGKSCGNYDEDKGCIEGCRCDDCDSGVVEAAEAVYDTGYRRNEWISCEDELPESGVFVLVTDGRFVDVGSFDMDDGLWWESEVGSVDPDGITHWMPFPIDPRILGKIPKESKSHKSCR